MDPKQAKNFESETKPGFFSDLGGYKQTDFPKPQVKKGNPCV